MKTLTKICFLILLSLVFSLFVIQSKAKLLPPLANSISPINCQNLQIWKIAELQWNNPIQLELSQAKPPPPDAGQIVGIPGPKRYQIRPYLKPFVSPVGLTNIVYKGSGEAMPLAISISNSINIIPLPEKPLNLAARSDGEIWVNTQYGELLHYDKTGLLQNAIKEVRGSRIIGAEKDAIWVINPGPKQAFFVTAKGDVKGPYTFEGLLKVQTLGLALCDLLQQNTATIKCLYPNGSEKIYPLSFSLKRTEILLSFTDNQVLTMTLGGSPITSYKTGHQPANIYINNAGLTSDGDAFIFNRLDDKWGELCVSNGLSRRLPIEYNNPNFSIGISFTLAAVAVEGEKTLLFGLDRATWYKGDKIESSFVVDEESFVKYVFPHLWLSNSESITAKSDDGTIILSTTGPSGMAIIGLRWNP